MYKRLICLICLLLVLGGCSSKKQVLSNIYFDYFDTVITVYDYEGDVAKFNERVAFIGERLAYYDELFSIFKAGDHNLFVLNALAGKEYVYLSDDLVAFLEYCKEVYDLTDGHLNVMAGSLVSLWKDFLSGGELPLAEELAEASEHISMDSLVIDGNEVMISDALARIDVGAVAKGYTGELLKQELLAQGATSMALDMGGNIVLIGSRPGGWSVGIRDPFKDGSVISLKLDGGCLVTSGNYERYRDLDGVRYHHIIDLDTYYPSVKYVSMSVVAEDSGLADILSTACFTMDEAEVLKLVERLEGVEVYGIYPDGSSFSSSGFMDLVK